MFLGFNLNHSQMSCYPILICHLDGASVSNYRIEFPNFQVHIIPGSLSTTLPKASDEEMILEEFGITVKSDDEPASAMARLVEHIYIYAIQSKY